MKLLSYKTSIHFGPQVSTEREDLGHLMEAYSICHIKYSLDQRGIMLRAGLDRQEVEQAFPILSFEVWCTQNVLNKFSGLN